MSTIKTNNILDVAGTALPSNLLPVTSSAWVSFDGTGVVSINDSHNVTSITDNGVGNYDVNFTNALSDTDFAALVASPAVTTSNADIIDSSTIRINVRDRNTIAGNQIDVSNVSCAVFGGQ